MKMVCTALIPTSDERGLVCDWLREIPCCTYNVIGTTVVATYQEDVTPNQSDYFWGLIHMFEQYPEHSIDTNVGKGEGT